MRTNIFMKSVLRQPIRTLVLAVLIGIAAFAFVARAAEFVIVRAEIRRVEGLFPSIGMLAPISPENFTVDHDVTQAAEVIAASSHLAFEDRRVFTQGVLQGRRNQVSHHLDIAVMVPSLEHIDIKALDQYFYATVAATPRTTRIGDMNFLVLSLEIDEHIVGDPLSLRDEQRTFTNERGQTTTLSNRQSFFLPLTELEAELHSQGALDATRGLVGGARYIFRGVVQNTLFGMFLRPLGGEDGLRFEERPLPGGMPGATFFELTILEELRDENLVFFVYANNQPAVETMLANIRDDLYIADMNLSSVTVVGTQDMSAIPRFTHPYNARLLTTNGGRWLNHDDHVNANPVALVPARLAGRSGLQLGETFTITLHSNPRPAWVDNETNSPWSRRVEGWWEHTYRGWWGLPAGDDWRDAETYELTLEVVGVYWYFPLGTIDNFHSNEIFIPASLIPDGFGWDNMPLLTGMYSFTLTSPRNEDAFIREHETALEQLGFTIGFVSSEFDIFDSAMTPTRMSVTINLAVFTAVSMLILILVIFLYLRQWSKALAIVRALGLPARVAMRRFFTPVFCIWVPAISIGAVVGWFFSLSQAEEALAAIADFGEAVYVDPNIGLFFALFAGIVFAAVAGVVSAGFRMANRPVLEQLQGTVQRVKRTVAVPESGKVNFSIPVGGFSIGKPLATTQAAALSTAFRHIARRILRTPVKSALALVLALFFVVSLGWMNHTIHFTEAEIERFMDTTVVSADIIRSVDDDMNTLAGNFVNAYIGHTAVDAMLRSGFVQDAYLEAVWFWGGFDNDGFVPATFMGVSCLDGFVAENTRTAMDTQLGVLGDSLEIELAPGFDFTFTPGSPVPIVVRQSAMYAWGMSLGDVITLYDTATAPRPTTFGTILPTVQLAQAEIVGYFTGGLNRAVDGLGLNVSFVMPREFLRYKFQEYSNIAADDFWGFGAITYATTRFYLDPTRNRELDRLPDLVFTQLTENWFERFTGPVPLELLIHDDIIRTVVEPMERNLALLRTLYPISIAAAIALGFGMSLLIMLTSIRNAAIMRVLGLSRSKTQISLWAEQFFICVGGIIVGLVVLVVIGVGLGATPFGLAGMYFVGATLGAALGAVIINAKAPLELLQVRE